MLSRRTLRKNALGIVVLATAIGCGTLRGSSPGGSGGGSGGDGGATGSDSPPRGDGGMAGGSGGASGAAGGAVATGGSAAGGALSIEFGRTAYGKDYAVQSSVPAGGTLFSLWTKIPDPGPPPWKRGNMDVYYLIGRNWYLRCLVGNSTAQSATNARYNANSMFFANPSAAVEGTWLSDYSYYESDMGHPEAPYKDWVWAAWQVIVGTDSVTLRQWLKFGLGSAVFAAGESAPTFSELRALMVSKGVAQATATAWTPSDAVSFRVGADDGYLTHARMMARSSTPTLDELEAIATSSAPDTTAWADYRLEWSGSAADLSDRSGHGHPLSVAAGGTLHPGPLPPSF